MFFINNYYVYHCYIEETNEIFYVGVGKGDERNIEDSLYYDAKQVSERFSTGIRIIERNLTRESAADLKYKEIARIVEETDYVLTNRKFPIGAKRPNFYGRGMTAPEFKKEVAPVLYACEVDEKYFGLTHRNFDQVQEEFLSVVTIVEKSIGPDELKIVYGGEFQKYYTETVEMLERNTSKILKTKYAKSLTAWIYISDDYITNFNFDREVMIEKLGRELPVYHLIDVWKYLKEKFKENAIEENIKISPMNNRVAYSKIKRRRNYNKGNELWRLGEKERKFGRFQLSLEYYDEARESGYFAPVLYESYVKVYRKIGDLANEIDILNEAVQVFSNDNYYSQNITKFYSQRAKAIKKLKKNQEKAAKILEEAKKLSR